jgi:hypothetical protein
VSDSTTAVPPGWYPDQSGQQRWWDGGQWTENVQTPYTAAARGLALKAPDGTKTGNVWIWLVAILPLFTYVSLFFIDIGAMFRSALASPTDPLAMYAAFFTPGVIISTVIGWLFLAAGIVFSVLDYRALKARGVPKPFHWGFAFFALAGYGIVYAIGRGVIVRSRTGSGMAPTVVAIVVFILGFVISIIWTLVMTEQMMTAIPTIPTVPVN